MRCAAVMAAGNISLASSKANSLIMSMINRQTGA